MRKDDLGNRMKEYYENIPKTKLMRRTPVAIRCDGRAFHNFTRGLDKPFDDIFISAMQDTMLYLCENIQGCVFGYTQSDEITLILIDYQNLNTSAWFDYEVQKICSISASMTTLAFNKAFKRRVEERARHGLYDELLDRYCKKIEQGAMFDARCFNIPKEEVANLIYWRQLNAIRNSVQMVGQANFSHTELQNKSCEQIKEKLQTERGIIWDNLPSYKKWGSCCVKNDENDTSYENPWKLVLPTPLFKGEERYYINKRILLDGAL